ncbi:polyphosphate kinase 1 [Ruminococcaceae bacterium OttesenSCG-928-I18]|nr:polyphosphate kinase 1 [Ruminococcaceae bacterium OttesenSCG-928-I18]
MNGNRESEIFINRELSWLEFNRRVLDLSREKTVPLGEKLNFAKIYCSNLDEFFMIRVGSLYDQTLLKNEYRENKTGMTPQQQLSAIMPKVAELQGHCDKNVEKIFRKLWGYGLEKTHFENLGKERENFWKKYFLRELFPVLSPQIVDRRHPFPFLRDREIYVGALIKEGKNEDALFGLIPISSHLERLITFSDGEVISYALVEELVLHFAEVAFGKANVLEKCLFRITRNADLSVEEGMFDQDIDYRSMMSELLKRRRKLAAVRLQFFGTPPPSIHSLLLEKLVLPSKQSFVQTSPLELSFLGTLADRLKSIGGPDMFYPVARPLLPPAGYSLHRDVLRQDVLIYYPYHSYRPFIQLLNEAAADPDVISIKMTLYRVATESKVISALIDAAENGKEVVTIVELRARFDEQNNIDWSRQLEKAGCTVIYGFSDYKIHSKLTLITRKRGKKYEYISQVGTGNYNERTSELYTDLAYLTSNQEIGEEVAAVFNNLALGRLTEHVNQLIVAPLRFKTVLLEEIREEIQYTRAGNEGRVILKCNSISDKEIIETLSEASIAGVPVDMIVRGVCCLQAGLEGLTENIRVRSLVGRYLEHARIYAFGQAERLRIYIASGDFLTRNTERRVEVGIRIDDADLKKTLSDILDMQLRDTVNASLMREGNTYEKIKVGKDERFDSQMQMYPYLQAELASLAKPVHTEKETGTAPSENGEECIPRRSFFRKFLARLFRR